MPRPTGKHELVYEFLQSRDDELEWFTAKTVAEQCQISEKLAMNLLDDLHRWKWIQCLVSDEGYVYNSLDYDGE